MALINESKYKAALRELVSYGGTVERGHPGEITSTVILGEIRDLLAGNSVSDGSDLSVSNHTSRKKIVEPVAAVEVKIDRMAQLKKDLGLEVKPTSTKPIAIDEHFAKACGQLLAEDVNRIAVYIDA